MTQDGGPFFQLSEIDTGLISKKLGGNRLNLVYICIRDSDKSKAVVDTLNQNSYR
jgi:hypothetical protein